MMWACSRLKTCGQWFLNYPLSAPPFVVWNYFYENGAPSFYWGAYSDEKLQATTTFIERIRALVSKLDWPAWCALRTQEESE